MAAIQGLDSYTAVDPDIENIRVIRCIDAYWGGGTGGSPSIHVIGHAGQTIVEFHNRSSNPTDELDSQSWHWEGRQVIPIAGVIGIEVAGPPSDITISGYALRP